MMHLGCCFRGCLGWFSTWADLRCSVWAPVCLELCGLQGGLFFFVAKPSMLHVIGNRGELICSVQTEVCFHLLYPKAVLQLGVTSKSASMLHVTLGCKLLFSRVAVGLAE